MATAVANINTCRGRLQCGLLALEAEETFIAGDYRLARHLVGQLADIARPTRFQYRLHQMRSRVLLSAHPTNRHLVAVKLDEALEGFLH